jgi:uncharacterized membrane protein
MSNVGEFVDADVVMENVMDCRICGGKGDRVKTGFIVCRKDPAHMADPVVGQWSDCSRAEEGDP